MSRRPIALICDQTGEIFVSQTALSIEKGIKYGTLIDHVRYRVPSFINGLSYNLVEGDKYIWDESMKAWYLEEAT